MGQTQRPFIIWLITGIIVLAVMLTHVSVPATILGRYSPSYAAGLAVAVASLIAAAFGWWLTARGTLAKLARLVPTGQPFAYGVIISSVLLLALLWWYLPGSRGVNPAMALFHLYVCGLVLMGMLALLRASGQFDVPVPHWLRRLGPTLLIALAVLLTVVFLGDVPPSRYYEEPYVANFAWSTYQLGRPDTTMVPEFTLEYLAMPASAFYPLLGLWYDLFGLTLDTSRLFWLLLGWLSVPFIFLSARRLYNPTAAYLAATLAALFLIMHNYVNPTLYVPAAVAMTLYFSLRGRDAGASLGWHFAAGLIVTTAIEGHAYGVRFSVAFGLYYLVEYGQMLLKVRRWRWNPGFWVFVAGGLTGAVLYTLLHGYYWMGSDISGMLASLQQSYELERAYGGNEVNQWSSNLRLTWEWLREYPALHPIEAAVALWGLLVALRRRSSADRMLVTIYLPSLLLLSAMIAHFNLYYWVHNLPFVAILGGAMLAGLAGQLKQASAFNLAALMLIMGVGALQLTNIALEARKSQDHDHLIDIGYAIDAVLPDHVQRVAAWHIYYYALYQREMVGTTSFKVPYQEWPEALGIEPPQAIAITVGLDDVRDELWDYIEAADMKLAQCWSHPSFGRSTQLYLLPDDMPPDAPINCD